MRYAQYGTNGPQMSRLGVGAMRLPKTAKGDVDFPRAVRLLRAAMAAGVNFFDSHHWYHSGQSETALGMALKGWTRSRIYIQTKTPWYQDKPTAFFEKLLREALKKLGVSALDYFFFHSMEIKTWKQRGRKFIKFTDWALKRGLIRHRGFSSHESPANIKAFVDTGEFSAMLLSYNWMSPQVRDVIAYGAEKGMGVAIMNPVGGGMLAESTPQVLRLLPGAQSPAELALRYVLATPGVCTAFSGVTTPAQLKENLAVASRNVALTATQQKRMQQRLGEMTRAAKQLCTSCGYCMPCPHGVDIAGNFRILGRARLFGHMVWGKRQYEWLQKRKEGDGSAAACRACGKCLPKCPNKIAIISQLKETAELFG
jgi:predicted aldo/keto reductase-like oxidoreductase